MSWLIDLKEGQNSQHIDLYLLLEAYRLSYPSSNSANNLGRLLLGGYEIHYDGLNLK